jgi:pyridoxine kinase
VFALERLGFPVIFTPTVLLPWHPGQGPGTRVVADPALIADQARWPGPETAAGCLTGYFGSAGQVEAAAALIETLRKARPAPLVLCDPVVGDFGGFYVAAGIRTAVLRLAAGADILTPNRFELAFLAGVDFAGMRDNAALAAAARSLGRPEVVVTSAFADDGATGALLVTPGGSELFAHGAVDSAPHGSGDLLAALYLGHRLDGADPHDALERAIGTTHRIIERAGDASELPLAANGTAVIAPPGGIRIHAVGD